MCVPSGAGRLGLGLVLPALQASGVPFAILQRPSREWSGLAEIDSRDRVRVTINGAPYPPAQAPRAHSSRCAGGLTGVENDSIAVFGHVCLWAVLTRW